MLDTVPDTVPDIMPDTKIDRPIRTILDQDQARRSTALSTHRVLLDHLRAVCSIPVFSVLIRVLLIFVPIFATSVLHTSIASAQDLSRTSDRPKVVYGEDNRRDLYEVNDPVLRDRAERSIFAMVSASDVNIANNGTVRFNASTLRESVGVCLSLIHI